MVIKKKLYVILNDLGFSWYIHHSYIQKNFQNLSLQML